MSVAYQDQETNTHYNYFRDYDPAIGRYVQSDPIGLAGGINTYAYVRGDPLSLLDPYGLQLGIAVSGSASSGLGVGAAKGISGIPGKPKDDDTFGGLFPPGTMSSSIGSGSSTQSGASSSSTTFCPPDDYCQRNAARLNRERNFLIGAIAEAAKLADRETLIAVNNQIVKFNREVEEHNRVCRQLPVLPLPGLYSRGLL